MAINVADNFSYLGGKPLDARVKYDTVANMVAVPAANLYDGCLAYVTGTKKNYQYDSSNTSDPTLGKWRELQTGGGGSTATVLSQTLTAGSTSITFINIPITGDYLIDFFTSTGINYTAINTATAGQVTLTFEAQASDVTVYCRIEEVTV